MLVEERTAGINFVKLGVRMWCKVDTKIQALSVETNKLSKLLRKDFFSFFVEKK